MNIADTQITSRMLNFCSYKSSAILPAQVPPPAKGVSVLKLTVVLIFFPSFLSASAVHFLFSF